MSTVSVIIAVYNGEKYLREAIDSVLDQTYTPIELIVINDGSSDQTEQIALKYGSDIRYFSQENRGQPAAQNCGLRMAKGEYISFLDADDLYMPNKTDAALEFLQENREADFVFGLVEQFLSPDLTAESKKKWACPTGITPGYLAAAGLFRKECFDRVGLFNEKQRIGVFIEWYMRAKDLELKEGLIHDLILRRRIHDSNMGINSQNMRGEYIQIVKAAMRRRQLTGG